MQVDSDTEIIRLDPNIIYESDESTSECEVKEENAICDNKHNNQQKARKKLNLQEYKLRRANKPAPVLTNVNSKVLELCENIPETLPPIYLPTDPRNIKMITDQQHIQNEQEEPKESENTVVPVPLHPDYEEIILVSIECNTDITIPPNECESQSSAKFLTNIVSNLQKDSLLTSPSTLFSSIHQVLHEKSNADVNSVKMEVDVKEHGENKVIMHLRKDRIRPPKCHELVQTDTSALFPPLILSPSLIFNRIKNARNFRRKASRSRSRSRSNSPEPEYYRRNSHKYPRSQHSTHSSSMNSSEMDSSDSDSSAYSSARSSDYDSMKRYDGSRMNYGYRNQRPQNYTYQDQRKIIYIGGLTEDVTKDQLRRMFLKYGTIRKISLHSKDENTLKYGFVTFADPKAAYEVLDKFVQDPFLSNYDLRFGGRRKFCRQSYADLDSLQVENELDEFNNNNNKPKNDELSFEDLLKMTKRKLCRKD